MNLVSTILSLLAPAIINRIAGSLGLNQGLVGKAIAAAVPAILAGLAGASSRSGGANQLSDILAKQDTGILGNLGSLIGGSGQQALVENGTGALSSLLGGSSSSALAGALAKFSGLNGAQSNSLLGLASSVVLGQLAQTQKSSGLNAGGLANLLSSQKDNIAAAMPPGFANLLDGSGLLDSLGTKLKAPSVAIASEPPSSITKWLLPLALALVGAYLVSSYGCERPPEATAPPADPPAAAAPTEPKVEAPAAVEPKAEAPAPAEPAAPATPVPPSVDVVGLTNSALSGLTTGLSGITGEATAKAAIPSFEDAGRQIETVKNAAVLLSADAKAPLAALVKTSLPGITAAIEKAVGIPGVAAILNPVLQPIVANLDAISKD